jgi:zinc protease
VSRLVLALSFLFAAAGVASADNKPMPAAAPASPAAATAAKTAPAADPWAGRKDIFVPSLSTPSTKVDLGAVQRYTLPNGLQVIAVPRHGAPVIDVMLAVRTGGATEPKDKAGLAQFTASMLRKGTTKRTADQISEQIDASGSTLDAESNELASFVTCSGRSRDLSLCFDLMSDVVENPSFPEAEMKEVRDQLLATIEATRDNPRALAAAHAGNFYFGDEDPRGRVPSKRSVRSIDRGLLAAYHDVWYKPNNSIIAVSGDFDAKTLRPALMKWFGHWKRGDVQKLDALKLPPAGPLKVRLVDKPDATQAQIVLVGPGIAHGDPDMCATTIMNYTLGGGAFSSRIMKVVRSEGAKTYSANSHFESSREPGTFIASTFTRDPELANTVKLLLGEIDKMKASGPTAEELTAAKANLVGGYGLKFETGSDVARQLLVATLDGLAPDFVGKVPACYAAVTAAQAAEAARAHLHPQALVVVGNAKTLTPLLTAAKLAPTETINYNDPIVGFERAAAAAAAAAKKDAAKQPDNAPAADVAAGKQLLQLALKQKGLDASTKIADMHVTGTGSMTAGGQNLQIGIEAYYVPGHGQHVDISLGPQEMTQVYVDGKMWVVAGGVSHDMPNEAALSEKADLWRNPNLVLWNAAQPGVKIRKLPSVVEGKNHYDVIQVSSADAGPTKLFLDEKTHSLVRIVYDEDSKQSVVELSKYKRDNGIDFARHIIQTDEQRIEYSIDKIELNKGVPKDTFKR